MKKDILNRRGSIFIIVVLTLSFIGCDRYKRYNTKEIKEIRNNVMQVSQSLVEEQEYWSIYGAINDTINSWIENQIGYYKYLNKSKKFEADSLICFNKDRNKLIICLLMQQMLETGVLDAIEYFYGVKIKNQWYFFGGATMYLPREYYQEDIHTPLSFEKLRKIATTNIYQGYLKKGKKGQWEINERFFATFNNDAYNYPFTTQEAWEESWLKLCGENWASRDTTNTK
jgi:hypothetical protein